MVTDTSRMERVQQSGSIARLGWPQDTSTDWEGDIPKDQDKVRDCRERCSSWTGLDDLRGRQLPSPFLLPLYSPWSHRSRAMRAHPALDQHLRLIRITSPPNERLQAQPLLEDIIKPSIQSLMGLAQAKVMVMVSEAIQSYTMEHLRQSLRSKHFKLLDARDGGTSTRGDRLG